MTAKLIEPVIRRLAAEHPDRRASCQYVSHDHEGNPVAPVCIVGCALYENGVSLALLDENEGVGAGGLPLWWGPDLGDWWVVDVQNHQDKGYTWAEAVRIADREADPDNLVPRPDLAGVS